MIQYFVHESTVRIFQSIIDALANGHLVTANETANQMLKEYGHPGHVLPALLIAARAQRAMGFDGIATEMFRMIPEYPSHGAHFVRAVARRELATLEG